MFYWFFLLFLMLCVGLFLSVFQNGRWKKRVKTLQVFIVAFSLGVFAYYFITKSVTQYRPNALTVQVINKLPLPLDFYLVKVRNDGKENSRYETRHMGNIRSDFYRIDYLDMKNADQYWLAGFMGKKNLVYFSQRSVPNKNEDQIVEVHNYINQSAKLSDISKTLISEMKVSNMKTAIWITLDLLLLFLNLALLFRKSPKKAFV